MKNISTIALCLFSITLRAAQEEKSIHCLVNGTLLSIIKGDISDYGDQAELMVVGWNEQRKFQKPDFSDRREVGTLVSHLKKTIYTLPKKANGSSDDDTYQPFSREDTDLWKEAQMNTVACTVLHITEPRIMHEDFGIQYGKTHGYFPQRWINPNKCRDFCFYGEDAFKEANNDLSSCYETILKQGTFFTSQTRIIALNSLSGDVGLRSDEVATVTFKAITDFLNDNSNKYLSVMVFIKKTFEFDLYRKLIAEYREKK